MNREISTGWLPFCRLNSGAILILTLAFFPACKSPEETPAALPPADKPTVIDDYADQADKVDSRAAAAITVAKEQLSKDPPKVDSAQKELTVGLAYLAKPESKDVEFARIRADKNSQEEYKKAIEIADKHQKELEQLWYAVEQDKQKAKDDLARKEAELVAVRKEKATAMAGMLGAGIITIGTLMLAFGSMIGISRLSAFLTIFIGAACISLPWIMDSDITRYIGIGIGVIGLAECIYLLIKWNRKQHEAPGQ
jgi:hypothetical protein